MAERTCTTWATSELSAKLSGLDLGGVTTQDGGWVSGEVSVSEKKGKSIPVYQLECELPLSGGGTMRLPDVSIEMLDDLEVEFDGASIDAAGADKIRAAVKEWAASVRKSVSDGTAPLDAPATKRTPRAAALISEEEAMSAGGAGALDDADDIEEVPRDDDDVGEEEPFTEEECEKMYEEARALLTEMVEEAELEGQIKELDDELNGRDLQERGRILVDVINYLESGEEEMQGEEGGEEDGQGGGGGGGAPEEPYPGKEGLERLWNEVLELCAEEDVPRLEEEVKDKLPEEQWKILLDVRQFLLDGDPEEQAAFDEWNPSVKDLDREWQGLMARVPTEEAEEVAQDYAKATAEEKKRMVWDVRNFLDEQEGEEEEGGETGGPPPSQPDKPTGGRPPPPRPPTDAELGGGPSEMRRRGGGASRGREYEARMECGFDDGAEKDGGEWDEYYSKEVRKGGKKAGGGGSIVMYGGACVLLGLLALVFTAANAADEDESVMAAMLRLAHLA